MRFPRHAASMTITHNAHLDYYMTVAVHLADLDDRDRISPSFDSPEERQRCIDTNELWDVVWYPDTPIGSYYVAASTLDGALARACRVQEEADAEVRR